MQSYSLCPGNPDCNFVELIEKESGEFKVIASLDTSEFLMNGHAIDKPPEQLIAIFTGI